MQHERTFKDVIGDLDSSVDAREINHVHFKDGAAFRDRNGTVLIRGKKSPLTIGNIRAAFKSQRDGEAIKFCSSRGRPYDSRVRKNNLDSYSRAVSSKDIVWRADTLNPLTIREKARIQGCPDNFIFKPLNYMKDDETIGKVSTQVTKFMPLEFTRHAMDQIFAALSKEQPLVASQRRYGKANRYINHLKKSDGLG